MTILITKLLILNINFTNKHVYISPRKNMKYLKNHPHVSYYAFYFNDCLNMDQKNDVNFAVGHVFGFHNISCDCSDNVVWQYYITM